MSRSCHELPEDREVLELSDKILLMGPPNVGKSVFFSELTSIHVVSSNYAGTTVSYMKGTVPINGKQYNLLDVPGTYSLAATSLAEEVALQFLASDPLAIVFVLNAADLEGSIKLLLEVQEFNIPVVAALNLADVANRKGMQIDVEALKRELGIPIVPTVAVKRQGLRELVDELAKVLASIESAAARQGAAAKERARSMDMELWKRAQEITAKCVRWSNSQPSFLDRLGDAMLKPWPGIPIAVLVMLVSIGVVVGAGKALRAALLLPLVNRGIVPLFEALFSRLPLPTVVHNVLIGEFGIFRISFEWILALVMPYVLLFQLVFSFLEDSGILPRIAVLFDNIMRKLGVQGGSLINIMLGYGCAVPAIIGTRTATTKKERLIVTTIVCFAVPCISQTGALFSLLAAYSYWLVLGVLLTGLTVFMLVSILSSKLIKGTVDPLVIEIPNLLIPERRAYFKKFFTRAKHFVLDAEGPMLVAVVIAAILAETGLLTGISSVLKPLVSGWLGLPPEASMSLILGIIRREMSVAPLLALDLDSLQVFVGAVVSLIYLPCMSVFAIVAKEFGAKVAVAITAGTTFTALFLGGVLNHLIRFVVSLV
ncbi:MAG: ferrous iron transporter B [Firmicutes bacterium]|nr:ferrous iron transporter B [Bacillota bacterium]